MIALISQALFSQLQKAVQGVGPGHSLSDTIQAAQSSLAAGNARALCGDLAFFDGEVKAQSGKKIPAAQSQTLLADANGIQAVLGCGQPRKDPYRGSRQTQAG